LLEIEYAMHPLHIPSSPNENAPPPASPLKNTIMKLFLQKAWKHILIWGIFSVLFGVIAFVWPAITLTSLVWVFAFTIIAQGIALAVGTWNYRKEDNNWWILFLLGLVNILAGVISIIYPGMTALVLAMLIGAGALVTGLLQVIFAIRLRKEIQNEGWLILGGVISIAFGLLLLIRPGEGALALLWILAVYAFVFGAMMIALALRTRKWIQRTDERISTQEAR
jgi:uncharacterized membrane protein HdeD (DUF308 family)